MTKKNFVNEEERSARFIISTNTQDRVGDIMEPKGIRLENYKKNPTVAFNHDTESIPIGTSEKDGKLYIDVFDDRVEATVFFHDVTKEAQECYELVKQGVLRMTSIGFLPIKVNETYQGPGTHVLEWDLLEWSIVVTPCNPDCSVVVRKFMRDNPKSRFIPALSKSLGEEVSRVVLDKSKFSDKKAALEWVFNQGYKTDDISETNDSWVFVQRIKDDFKRGSLHEVKDQPGVTLIQGQIRLPNEVDGLETVSLEEPAMNMKKIHAVVLSKSLFKTKKEARKKVKELNFKSDSLEDLVDAFVFLQDEEDGTEHKYEETEVEEGVTLLCAAEGEVCELRLSKEKFETAKAAEEWMKEHEFETDNVEETETEWIFYQGEKVADDVHLVDVEIPEEGVVKRVRDYPEGDFDRPTETGIAANRLPDEGEREVNEHLANDDAYTEGYRARVNEQHDNPYEPKTIRYKLWNDGYKSADDLYEEYYELGKKGEPILDNAPEFFRRAWAAGHRTKKKYKSLVAVDDFQGNHTGIFDFDGRNLRHVSGDFADMPAAIKRGLLHNLLSGVQEGTVGDENFEVNFTRHHPDNPHSPGSRLHDEYEQQIRRPKQKAAEDINYTIAWDEGYQARLDELKHKTEIQCPYKDGIRRDAWIAGYELSDRKNPSGPASDEELVDMRRREYGRLAAQERGEEAALRDHVHGSKTKNPGGEFSAEWQAGYDSTVRRYKKAIGETQLDEQIIEKTVTNEDLLPTIEFLEELEEAENLTSDQRAGCAFHAEALREHLEEEAVDEKSMDTLAEALKPMQENTKALSELLFTFTGRRL